VNYSNAKYIKKNIILIISVAILGFVLLLCSAGTNSNNNQNENQVDDANNVQKSPEKQTTNLFANDTSFNGSSLNGTGLFYRTMIAIFLVIVLGAAAIFITKKFLPGIAKLQGKEIRVIETVHLGPRKSVHLIEIGKRRLLIASTNENIRKLADLTEFSPDIQMQETELS
jgi:flagellar biosynthetic protein FliO